MQPAPLKFCTSCAHFRDDRNDGGCAHPSLIYDPVRGSISSRSAARMRESDGPCGPEGRLFYYKGDPSNAGAPETRYGEPESPPQRHVPLPAD